MAQYTSSYTGALIDGLLSSIKRTDVSSTSTNIDTISSASIINFLQIAVAGHPFFPVNTHIGDVCIVFTWDDNTKYYLYLTTAGDMYLKQKNVASWKKVSMTSV